MPKKVVLENRYDFRGGRNTSISAELLNENELVDTTNARLSQVYGGFTKRSGCRKIHNTALIGPVYPFQWDFNGVNNQIMVIDGNGKLWVKPNDFTSEFTDTGFTPALAAGGGVGAMNYFVPFRDASAGAPLKVFCVSSKPGTGKYFTWDGAAVVNLLPLAGGVPVFPTLLAAYHTRLFTTDQSHLKTIFWSKVGDGTSFQTGTKTDGGFALVDVLRGETNKALEVIGSSLLIATNDCVMRFTGQSSDDIVIAQDTEGVSSEIGVIATPQCGTYAMTRFENVAGFLSRRGPYAATETSVIPIGEQVLPDFQALPIPESGYLDTGQTPLVIYNRNRKELLFIVPTTTLGGANFTMYAYSTRLQCWYGPWIYSFSMFSACQYVDPNGVPGILTGSGDGFVRSMDTGTTDNQLKDGTGGVAIPMTVELPVMHFGDPGLTKSLWRMLLQATLPTGSNLMIETSFDDGSVVLTPASAVLGSTEADFRIDLGGQSGKRLKVRFLDSSSQAPIINGFTLTAFDMQRV